MDTIVALATPPGRSGIGVIRLSGDGAFEIVRKLTNDPGWTPVHRTTNLRKVYEIDGDLQIDEALISSFHGPNSFTGEDIIEISCHGSPLVLRRVIDACLEFGARLADAGEFTLRALSNSRIDLSQAEAIRDLIDANSVEMTRQALRQLNGEFSFQLQPLKSDLLDIIVILESALEFVEDDLPESQTADILVRLKSIADQLSKLASTYQSGKLLREGIRVALVGRPNVGKSSIFNALVGSEQAIVTEIPGTTRDQVRDQITIEGISVHLIDTAGLRETVDEVEKIGVARARRVINDVDLVLVVLDGSVPLVAEDWEILELVKDLNHLIVLNKNDLGFGEREGISEFVSFSAKTLDGIALLEKAVINPFKSLENSSGNFLVSDARHRDLLLRSHDEIVDSLRNLENGMSEEFTLVGLHNAIRFLGEITGETTTEDMLTRIFSTFCIGK